MKKILFIAFVTIILFNYFVANQAFAGTTGGSYDAGGQLIFPEEFGLPDPAGGVRGVLASFLNWALTIIGIIALVAFVISGLQYFMSSGDEKMSATAKRNMTYSILGIIAALSGYVIILTADSLLRGQSGTGTGGTNYGTSGNDTGSGASSSSNDTSNSSYPNSGYIPNEGNTPDVSGNNVQSTDPMTYDESRAMSPN